MTTLPPPLPPPPPPPPPTPPPPPLSPPYPLIPPGDSFPRVPLRPSFSTDFGYLRSTAAARPFLHPRHLPSSKAFPASIKYPFLDHVWIHAYSLSFTMVPPPPPSPFPFPSFFFLIHHNRAQRELSFSFPSLVCSLPPFLLSPL